MDKRSQLLSPEAPTQDLTKFSFCKATARELSVWILGLPKANLGELSRLLFQALNELNRLQINANLRFQLLEILRPEISFLTKQLEKNHLQHAIILDERSRKVANFCQAMQNMQTTVYKHCIKQLAGQRSSLLAYCTHRAIESLYTSLYRCYLLFYPVPAGLWFDLHQLYVSACKNSLQTQRLKDPLLEVLKDQSIEEAYSSALLLGSARINQMRQNDIMLLKQCLPHWCSLTSIQRANAPDSLFVIAPQSDMPPRYKALLNLKENIQLIGFNCKQLTDKLEAWVSQPAEGKNKVSIRIPNNAQPAFIYQLCNAWGDIAKRDFKRVPGTGSLELCLGMTAVHYYLSGQKSFDETLQQQQASRANYKLDNSAPDIWANAIDAQSSGSDLLDEFIEYTPKQKFENTHTKAEQVQARAQVVFPVYTINIINHSPGGYCLEWPSNAPSQLQAGDIIGLKASNESQWTTAVIRWIRQIRDGGAQIGVELLAPNAQPCGVQLIRSGTPSNYLRCLLAPEITAIARPATLITPRVPFQEGSRVNINHLGKETKAVLGKRSVHTASISQYEYAVSLPPRVANSATEPIKNKNPQDTFTFSQNDDVPSENFDSLWKIL